MNEDQPGMPAPSVTKSAIPYFPDLLDLVPTITCAVLVTYLEMRYPCPIELEARGQMRRTSSLPVTVSADEVCRDLRVSRRTLALSLYAISRVFPSEASRWAAQRAGREFIIHHHRRNPTVKLYSAITCDRALIFDVLTIRRNLHKLPAITAIRTSQTPASSLATSHSVSADPNTGPAQARFDGHNPSVAPPLLLGAHTLTGLLLKSSVLSGDRREVRYERLRKAVKGGLEGPEVLSARQPRRKTPLNKGVQPDLPDELTNRLARTKSKVLDPVEDASEGATSL